ncbi:MAG: chemotaxis protein CheX [Candidatus Lambdaproteobacteria bacterium]|nr:chemotaxis protein CheX [Candidatus Lambdaproteobacteria bacterium]
MDVENAVNQALDEVLDKMAFLFFDEFDADAYAGEGFALYTQVAFKGIVSGELFLSFTRATADQLARNLIGIRDGDELYDGTREDAVREFTNILVGRTMTLLSPNDAFELTVPRIIAAPPGSPQAQDLVVVEGGLEDEPFKVVVVLK